jgi:hypothetical protein
MLGAFGSRHGNMLAFKVLVLALKANTADTAPKGSRPLMNLGTRTYHLQQEDHRNDVKVSEILEDWVALTRDVNKGTTRLTKLRRLGRSAIAEFFPRTGFQ